MKISEMFCEMTLWLLKKLLFLNLRNYFLRLLMGERAMGILGGEEGEALGAEVIVSGVLAEGREVERILEEQKAEGVLEEPIEEEISEEDLAKDKAELGMVEARVLEELMERKVFEREGTILEEEDGERVLEGEGVVKVVL